MSMDSIHISMDTIDILNNALAKTIKFEIIVLFHDNITPMLIFSPFLFQKEIGRPENESSLKGTYINNNNFLQTYNNNYYFSNCMFGIRICVIRIFKEILEQKMRIFRNVMKVIINCQLQLS